MNVLNRHAFARIVTAVVLTVVSVVIGFDPAFAVEAGQAAPDFKLPSTLGNEVLLRVDRFIE